jgi:O-antigen/teichoic acid export membrane protein
VLFLVWINIDFIFDLLPNGDIYRLGKWAVLFLSLGRLINSTLSVTGTALGYSKYYYYSLIFTILLACLSIGLNQWLVPKWDINGGALASVGSYTVYYVLLVAFIRWKIGIQPFSGKMFPVALTVLALFALNWGWTALLTPWFAGLFAKPILGLLIDAALKSSIFVILGVMVIYKLKVSQSVNDLIDKAKGLRKKA